MKKLIKKINGSVADVLIIDGATMKNARIACRPRDEKKAAKEARDAFGGNALVRSIKPCAVTIALPWEVVVKYAEVVKEEEPDATEADDSDAE